MQSCISLDGVGASFFAILLDLVWMIPLKMFSFRLVEEL